MNCQERIMPGYKLVLANPAVAEDQKPKKSEIIENLLTEYFSIYNALLSLVGEENLAIPVYLSPDWTKKGWPNLKLTYIPALKLHYRLWPRDAVTVLNRQFLPYREAWDDSINNTYQLGEGGAVLARSKAVLVHEDLFTSCGDELDYLIQNGYKVASLPKVNVSNPYIREHLDGKASLVESKDGRLILLVARSYDRQGLWGRVSKTISNAATIVGAEKIVIPDKNLPPMVLNFPQFQDGSVLITKDATELEALIKEIVGEEKVFTTDRTIEMMPRYTGGGIRCLTNTMPDNLIYTTVPSFLNFGKK